MRAAVVVVAVGVAATLAGCPPPDCDSVEPAYAGEASDEAWRVMLDGRAQAEEADEVVFSAPERELSVGSDVVSFAWDSSLQVTANVPWGTRPRPTFFDRLSSTIIPSAHAHLPPVTSDVYFLEVDVAENECPVSGLTTLETFLFDDDDWARIVGSAGEKKARLMSAFLTENRITEGPFLSKPLTISVVE